MTTIRPLELSLRLVSDCVMVQILRWNWCRAIIALSFAEAVAPMSFALRHSILPLIDSTIDLAMPYCVDTASFAYHPDASEECVIRRSAIDLQLFTHTAYFENEVNCSVASAIKLSTEVPDAPDS